MNFAAMDYDQDDERPDVFHLTPEQALEQWPECEPLVARAMEHSFDDTTTDDILARVMSGNLLMMVVVRGQQVEACMCLEIVKRLSGKTCHCMILAGDDLEHWAVTWMRAWVHIARQLKCDKLSIKGRPGWAKYAAREFGFKHRYTIMSLEI